VNWRLSKAVSLKNERISAVDATRQRRTAVEILKRFDRQPGIVLADEVGLGKTYVALAVAVSVAADESTTGPVVVMVPPSVGHKWPREWDTFRSKCLDDGLEIRATAETVRSGSEFLKLLDDPEARAHDIVFLTHGALTGSLTDPLVRLAIVRRALCRPSLAPQRAAFPRWADRVIPRGWEMDEDLVETLIASPPSQWLRVHRRATGEELADDPVPEAIVEALATVDLSDLIEACRQLPVRSSPRLDSRLKAVRRELGSAVGAVWREALSSANLHLPLLILDEAHHAKNPGTRLAGLFADSDESTEARMLSGPLAGVFDRMLFLTATPLQLAHRELIEVLRRFEGVRWEGLERDAYAEKIGRLEAALDAAQAASIRLDRGWSAVAGGDLDDASPRWWSEPDTDGLPESLKDVAGHIAAVRRRTRAAQRLLRPLVIRHSRSGREDRRSVHCGRAILDPEEGGRRGLEIRGEATLPFLLAARAQALVLADEQRGGARGRALFAEGLASSFEAYAQTRVVDSSAGEAVDDPALGVLSEESREAEWYLDQIGEALPDDDHGVWGQHPKIAATVMRAIELWQRDEKVLIFCYFRATGRALRDHVSREIDRILIDEARRQLGRRKGEEARVRDELRRRRERFFDPDAPVTKIARSSLGGVLNGRVDPEQLDAWIAVMLRFLGTGSFLVRHVGLKGDAAQAFEAALRRRDRTRWTLRERLESFAGFLGQRTAGEQAELLERLSKLASASGERDGEVQLPNVRLANGEVERDTRERLLAGFNTPFFPDILIASSVMAEGVDLHLNCRHVIHHDLDWNPSVIEQRTGRLDRIGSSAEVTSEPVVVFEPFLEATQDEKMFRVMKDRERWFNVVMGERLELDEWSTERISSRVALPQELASELTLDLALH
jgi:helicase-like protein/SNF2 domain-containing protein